MTILFGYPRLVAFLFAAGYAGLITFIVCTTLHTKQHLVIYISSAMISASVWAPLICKRIADPDKQCSYIHAAVLGFSNALLAMLCIGFPIGWEKRLVQTFYGASPLSQTLKLMLVDDLISNIGCGLFSLVLFGWYIAPMGGLGGIFMLEICNPFKDQLPSSPDTKLE